MRSYMADLIAQPRAAAQQDLLSALIEARDEPPLPGRTARTHGTTGASTLLDRFDDLRSALPEDEIPRKSGMLVRGPRNLPLTWARRTRAETIRVYSEVRVSWQVHVDAGACVGSGMCTAMAADYFRLVDGTSQVRHGDVEPVDAVVDAAESCPVEAITVRDARSGRLLAPEF